MAEMVHGREHPGARAAAPRLALAAEPLRWAPCQLLTAASGLAMRW